MCFSAEASLAMVGVGIAATGFTVVRGDPPAIWIAMGYFTVMEALQLAGYGVVNQCGTSANQAVTAASYLHIVFQPFIINAFAMELVPPEAKHRFRKWVFGICGLSVAVMVVQVLPLQMLGSCRAGTALCGTELCTVSGNWHIAWQVPYNGLLLPLEDFFGIHYGFPTYIIAVFLLPIVYGAWRFALAHLITGPVLASAMTSNMNEMPAIWCFFSILILLIGLSRGVRRRFAKLA